MHRATRRIAFLRSVNLQSAVHAQHVGNGAGTWVNAAGTDDSPKATSRASGLERMLRVREMRGSRLALRGVMPRRCWSDF
jgi:hypothetical protein